MSNVSPSDGGYNYYQRQIDDLEDEIRTDAKKREEKRQEVLESQAKHHEEELRRKDEQHAEEVGRLRDDASERIENVRKTARDDVAQAKTGTYDRYGKLLEQAQAEREESRRAVDQAMLDLQMAATRDRSNRERTSEGALREEMAREVEGADRLRESHSREVATLRGQIQDFTDQDRQTLHGFNEGRSAAIREFENDFRDKAKIQQDAVTAELAAVKERGRQQSRYFAEANDRNLKDQGMVMTHMLNDRTDEAHKDRRMLEDQFLLDRQQTDLRAKQDREYAQRVLEERLDQAGEDRNRALYAQANAYGESYESMAHAKDDKIARLEQGMQQMRTTGDPSQISPAAEEAVREATHRELGKTMDADQKRQRGEIESMRQNFHDRYTDLLEDKRITETRMAQNGALQSHQDQQAYIDSVTEITQSRDDTIRSKDSDHQRASDALTHDHARALDQQRREYEDIIQNLKNDANLRIGTMRQDNEFNSKMAQKSFSAGQNELIREYEKKLADQKQDYDAQLGDLKSEMAQTQRESERHTKQALEEQSKGYEQRIAQMEFQNRERERLITQNSQDELEKVKRSNALLIQKKS